MFGLPVIAPGCLLDCARYVSALWAEYRLEAARTRRPGEAGDMFHVTQW